MEMLSPAEMQSGKKATFSSSSKRVHASPDFLGYAADSSSRGCLLARECKSKAIAGGRRTNKLSSFSSSRIIKRNLRESDEGLLSPQRMDMTSKNCVADSASSLSVKPYCFGKSTLCSTFCIGPWHLFIVNGPAYRE